MKGKFLSNIHKQSYLLQMTTIHSLKGKSVLEIGPGEHFACRNLKMLGYEYHTVDMIDNFNPTYLCSLEDLNIDRKYDIVCAFQMLEHIPYEDFLTGLKKMATLSNKYIVISLPYSCKGYQKYHYNWNGQNKCTKAQVVEKFEPTNLPERTDGPKGGHYWEIGRAGKTAGSISKDIRSCGLKIIKQFHSPNPYHYFFIMEK